MSVWEYARRNEVEARNAAILDEAIAKLLARPTPARCAADFLEEQAELLVRQAIQLRETAALMREELEQARRVA
jgi:hypothetical protein